MKLNTKGIAHLPVIILAFIVIAAIGFGGYKIGQKNSNENANSNNESGAVDQIAVKEQSSNAVEVPKEKTPEVDKTETVETTKTDAKPPEVAPKKDDKSYLSINLVTAKQTGIKVDVHSQIEKAVSGTCNFKLYREGYDIVHSSKKISNSKDCKGQIDISDMPNYSGWSLHVWFDGDDGKTFAYQQEKAFALSDPN